MQGREFLGKQGQSGLECSDSFAAFVFPALSLAPVMPHRGRAKPRNKSGEGIA